jgi:hypothetical protein
MAEHEEANSHLSSELVGCKEAFAELLSKYKEQNNFSDGLKNCNVALHGYAVHSIHILL